jgi:hypothetical protein
VKRWSRCGADLFAELGGNPTKNQCASKVKKVGVTSWTLSVTLSIHEVLLQCTVVHSLRHVEFHDVQGGYGVGTDGKIDERVVAHSCSARWSAYFCRQRPALPFLVI